MMATGFIHNMINEDMSFKDFVLYFTGFNNCERAIGSTYDYLVNEIKNDTDELNELSSAQEYTLDCLGTKMKNEIIEYHKKELDRSERIDTKLKTMCDMVNNWDAPKSCDKVKNYMLKDIQEASTDTKYHRRELEKESQKTPLDFVKQRKEELNRYIKSHQEDLEKENVKIEDFNKQKQDILNSLKD